MASTRAARPVSSDSGPARCGSWAALMPSSEGSRGRAQISQLQQRPPLAAGRNGHDSECATSS